MNLLDRVDTGRPVLVDLGAVALTALGRVAGLVDREGRWFVPGSRRDRQATHDAGVRRGRVMQLDLDIRALAVTMGTSPLARHAIADLLRIPRERVDEVFNLPPRSPRALR